MAENKFDIKKVLKDFIGEINQVPPKYSAIKINGKRACDLARENIDFEIKKIETKKIGGFPNFRKMKSLTA